MNLCKRFKVGFCRREDVTTQYLYLAPGFYTAVDLSPFSAGGHELFLRIGNAKTLCKKFFSTLVIFLAS